MHCSMLGSIGQRVYQVSKRCMGLKGGRSLGKRIEFLGLRKRLAAYTHIEFVWRICTFAALAAGILAADEFNGDLTRDVAIGILLILLSLFVDQLLTTYTSAGQRDALANVQEQIIHAIDRNFSLEVMSGSDAVERLAQRIVNAVEVKNTFVGYQSGSSDAAAINKNAIDVYLEFFGGRGELWTDLVGFKELHGRRFRSLYTSIRNKKIGRLSEASHVVRILRHNIPVLNFTIIYYTGYSPEREVIFGWLHGSSVHGRGLYRSTQPMVIDLFESYYDLLTSYNLQGDVNIDYEASEPQGMFKGLTRVDKAGRWLCYGYRDDGSDGEYCKDEIDPVSISVFDIRFRDDDVHISGRVYWYKTRKTENIGPRVEDISFRDDKMFLEYKKGGPVNTRGICVYKFRIVESTREDLLVEGYLQNDCCNYRVQLKGIRIGDQYSNFKDIVPEEINTLHSLYKNNMHLAEIAKNLPDVPKDEKDADLSVP